MNVFVGAIPERNGSSKFQKKSFPMWLCFTPIRCRHGWQLSETDSKPKPSTSRHVAFSYACRDRYAWRKWFASFIPNGGTFGQHGGGGAKSACTMDCSATESVGMVGMVRRLRTKIAT